MSDETKTFTVHYGVAFVRPQPFLQIEWVEPTPEEIAQSKHERFMLQLPNTVIHLAVAIIGCAAFSLVTVYAGLGQLAPLGGFGIGLAAFASWDAHRPY